MNFFMVKPGTPRDGFSKKRSRRTSWTCGIITTLFLMALTTSSNSVIIANAENFTGNMIKMCLFYPSPSGHARSDPIISQTCPSDHVHTFYGPQNFHPNTSYENLRDTKGRDSTTPFRENQSLYWHPSVYRVIQNQSGETKYRRVSNLESSPYYRWDNSVLPKTEAFPPGFRMIAYSNQQNAQIGGESGGNIFVECCDFVNNEEQCTATEGSLTFPKQKCDFVGFAFAMPTCWNGDLGIEGDHINHMAYTVDGSVAGACPPGYDRRVPQIQLFVRIENYKGGTYVLSDETTDVFHVDFMNGWEEGVLQKIIDECPVVDDTYIGYNPPCNCEQFLTENTKVAETPICDNDVRNFILNEPTDVVDKLPRGTCQGPGIIPKSWDVDPPFDCDSPPAAPTPPVTPPTPPSPTPPSPTPQVPTICPVESVVGGTYYFALNNWCWKLELFQSGKLEIDSNDSTCSNAIFKSSGIFSLFGPVDNTNNVFNFIQGSLGWTGTFQFVQDPTLDNLQVVPESIDQNNKVYAVKINVPTCTAPSMTCPIEYMSGNSYYFTIKDRVGCYKVELLNNGKFEADLNKDLTECTKDTFTSTVAYSTFQSIDMSTDQAIFQTGPTAFSGTFIFVSSKDTSMKNSEGMVLSFDSTAKKYELKVTVPTCASN